jgi:hypothetical protein
MMTTSARKFILACSSVLAALLAPITHTLAQDAADTRFHPNAHRHYLIVNASKWDGTAELEITNVCEVPSEELEAATSCPKWQDPPGATYYFTAGSLIYVEVFPPSTTPCVRFSLVTNGVVIAEDRPIFNSVAATLENKKLAGPVCNPIYLFLGQFTTNYIGTFSVCGSNIAKPKQADPSEPKETGPPTDGVPGTPCSDSTAGKPQTTSKTTCPPKTQCPCPCGNSSSPSDGSPTKGSSGTLVAKANFEVHKLYRGNIVAGFFVSSLVNRQYGITNNGQSTSTTNLTYVTVVGPTTRPQYHAFVGVNIYLWSRDVFPGATSRQGFLGGNKKPNGLNGYWNPGILIGYGVDATNNYLAGLNWEIPWINIGSGVHIGQETFLQPGIVPGVTQLPSGATAAPTLNRTSYGWYGSVGFDLNVMKAALSQLFGGGSNVAK